MSFTYPKFLPSLNKMNSTSKNWIISPAKILRVLVICFPIRASSIKNNLRVCFLEHVAVYIVEILESDQA